jgi:Leucine-rich repeat (LRR) protein
MSHDQAYLQAEKKIEEVQRIGGKILDFSHMNLAKLPESLRRLSNLQWLHLASNSLILLPNWLGDLTQLQRKGVAGSLRYNLKKTPRGSPPQVLPLYRHPPIG